MWDIRDHLVPPWVTTIMLFLFMMKYQNMENRGVATMQLVGFFSHLLGILG